MSKERAEILNERFKEGFEQLQDISAQMAVFTEKMKKTSRLTTKERQRYTYLEHLTKRISATVSSDEKKINELALTLTLMSVFTKLEKQATTSKDKEFYKTVLKEAEEKARSLQKELQSAKIQWAIVGVFTLIVLAVLLYIYSSSGISIPTKSFDLIYKETVASTKGISTTIGNVFFKLATIFKALGKCGKNAIVKKIVASFRTLEPGVALPTTDLYDLGKCIWEEVKQK